MQPLKLEILPITEHCTKCDYEDSYSLNSYHVKCPKCGENSITSGPRRIQAIFVTRNYGSYNLLNPSEKQWNYTFHNLPEGLKGSYIIDEEFYPSDMTILQLAEEIKCILDRYIYTKDKEHIAALVEYLTEHEEEIEIQQRKRKIQELELQLYKEHYYLSALETE